MSKKSKKPGMGKMMGTKKQGHGRSEKPMTHAMHMGGGKRGLSTGGSHDHPPMGRNEMKSRHK